MNVSALTLLIIQINKLIDSGEYNDISINDVHNAIEKKQVLRYLKNRAGSDIDLSMHLESSAYAEFEAYYENKLADICCGYAGSENKKWGIENLGLCLILAWTNEIIQQGEGLEWAN